MRFRKDGRRAALDDRGRSAEGNTAVAAIVHKSGKEEFTVTDAHYKPPGVVTPLAIASGAAVLIPSLLALVLAVFAAGAAILG